MTSQRLYEKWLNQNATQKNSKEAYFNSNIRHHVRINSEQPIAFGFKAKQQQQQQVPDNTPTAVTHYKKNTKKQVSCAVVMNQRVNDSAVWEKSPANNVNMTFEKLLQRDESQEKPFSKLNSRQNSIDEQQRSSNVITASKKPKIMVPTPQTNYNSNQNENINSSNRRIQESSMHYFTKQLSQVKAFPALKTLDIKTACEQNHECSIKITQHLSDLLSERQKISNQKQQNNQKISKKNTQRCFSMDGVAARRRKSKVPTPDDQSFMCDEEEIVQIPGIDFIQIPEDPMSQETLQYLMLRELDFQVDALYLRKHPSLTKNMRAILMDWMMEVCAEFNLKRETYHLAIVYVDRFLTITSALQKVQLQLLGVTSMFMAAKVEVPICYCSFYYFFKTKLFRKSTLQVQKSSADQLIMDTQQNKFQKWKSRYSKLYNGKLLNQHIQYGQIGIVKNGIITQKIQNNNLDKHQKIHINVLKKQKKLIYNLFSFQINYLIN